VSDLVAFLRARLDEDEQATRAALGGPWIGGWEEEHLVDTVVYGQSTWPGHLGQVCNVDYSHQKRSAEHIARWDTTRVLAEVAAKRAIVDDVADDGPLVDDVAAVTLYAVGRWLAEPYSDHPDYDPAWRMST
jgi:hypothetical protein